MLLGVFARAILFFCRTDAKKGALPDFLVQQRATNRTTKPRLY
jgi:hypothetical protein